MQALSSLEQIFDPIGECLDRESAWKLSQLNVAPEVQARLEYLAERSTEGLLTQPESEEYDLLISATDFLSILKRKAQLRLQSGAAA